MFDERGGGIDKGSFSDMAAVIFKVAVDTLLKGRNYGPGIGVFVCSVKSDRSGQTVRSPLTFERVEIS